jgi:hypothetical protein
MIEVVIIPLKCCECKREISPQMFKSYKGYCGFCWESEHKP